MACRTIQTCSLAQCPAVESIAHVVLELAPTNTTNTLSLLLSSARLPSASFAIGLSLLAALARRDSRQAVLPGLQPALLAACMSLFGDLPSAKNGSQPASSLAASLGKRSLHPPPSILRNKKKKREADGGSARTDCVASTLSGFFSAFGDIEDEYDPAVPNEYLRAKEEQERAVLEAEMDARRAAEDRAAVCNLFILRPCHCACKAASCDCKTARVATIGVHSGRC